jgi:hypothetical protein
MPRDRDSGSTERVLLIGDCPQVVAARAQVLAEWKPIVVDSNQARMLLKTETFDTVLIGHTVSDDTARLIIRDLKASVATQSILLIRVGNPIDVPGIDISVWRSYENPAWLQRAVAAQLAHKVASAA